MAKILVALTLASIGTLVTASSLKPQNAVTKQEFEELPAILHDLAPEESPRGIKHLKPQNAVTKQEFKELPAILQNFAGKESPRGIEHLKTQNAVTKQDFKKLPAILQNLAGKESPRRIEHLKPQNAVTKQEIKKLPAISQSLARKESPRGINSSQLQNAYKMLKDLLTKIQKFVPNESLEKINHEYCMGHNVTWMDIIYLPIIWDLLEHPDKGILEATDKLPSSLFDCKVSLPQKTGIACCLRRILERLIKKASWTLAESPSGSGFMVLNRKPPYHVLRTLVDPFTRYNTEEYLQTVLLNDHFHIVENLLSNKTGFKQQEVDTFSKFFEMTSKLGGEVALRPSQYEAFVDKEEWIQDEFFTQQRLAGVNPMSLMRVTNSSSKSPVGLDWKELKDLLNPEFKWTDAVQRALGTDDLLNEAIDQGRLYALRYEFMDNLPKNKDLTDDTSREVWGTYSPIALFASKQDTTTKRNKLVPVAIQMDSTPDSAVYTPNNEDNWMLAKLNLQITDLGYSQIVEHLGKVHLLMEPFCVILKRAMASEHPLFQILKYHCRDVTLPNSVGTPAIFGKGEFVDKLFTFGSEGANRLLKDAHTIATWEVTDFRGEIKRRGLDDKELIPYFPYRDDGEKVLEVIENMVKEYIDLYYKVEEDVKEDYELQYYLKELSAKEPLSVKKLVGTCGKIKGLPDSIDNKTQLHNFVTRIISQLTIQHAAVNYPLTDYAQYIPNLPTKLYNDTRVNESKFDTSRLPNKKTAWIQTAFTNILASYRYDTLFDYGNDLKDNDAVELLNRHFANLTTVLQPEMQTKNQQRMVKGYLTYPYFIPRWLPNGIQT